ncbi:hypothetical protein ANN_25102 [Periplaneta americana]|uniref:Reverse transcriptase domain-containing protein n=1 Tax=Periplaneta americana TaxID=6978 RepID=A0ABQ8S0L7_PERAM|nr:hypothetical protein ANN_25102 [Periplaneta americana]
MMLKLIRKRKKELVGSLAEKKLPTEGCTGRNVRPVYVIDVYKLTPSNGPKERSRRARDLTVASDNLSAIEFRPGDFFFNVEPVIRNEATHRKIIMSRSKSGVKRSPTDPDGLKKAVEAVIAPPGIKSQSEKPALVYDGKYILNMIVNKGNSYAVSQPPPPHATFSPTPTLANQNAKPHCQAEVEVQSISKRLKLLPLYELKRNRKTLLSYETVLVSSQVEKFKYLGATVTNVNDTREEIKRRINMGNACYYSVEKLLSSSLLSKNLKVRIYKTVILPVLLYGCETWTLTLREEHRLRVFENKVLRKIFGAKRDEVTGEWRKLHNTELHALYSSPDIIRNLKSRRLRWAGHVARMGESRNAYRVLVGRPEGKRPLGRPRRRWEDNIKMDLREVGYDDRDWLNLAQDRDRWRAYVRAAMNLRVP